MQIYDVTIYFKKISILTKYLVFQFGNIIYIRIVLPHWSCNLKRELNFLQIQLNIM